jgi:cell division septation protein DedD
MRARKLQTFLVGAIALLALGACGNGDGGSGGGSDSPVPTTIASDSTVPAGGSKLTEAQLEQLCNNPDPPPENAVQAADAADDNPYAAAVDGVARAAGQLCKDREDT